MKRLLCLFILCCVPIPAFAVAPGIYDTKHNLSITGPGEVKALTEHRICIFCHTPHSAKTSTPLWNREIDEGVNYDLYESTTFNVTLTQPSGASRLCLGCHDGTVALGAILGDNEIVMTTTKLTGRPSSLGTDLTNDHPFSFVYDDALPYNSELMNPPAHGVVMYDNNVMHCSSCHDPHDNSFGMFLVVSNKYSGLCILCHSIPGWASSTHALSTATWSGADTNPWPLNERLELEHQSDSVAENGCNNCHTSHNAGGPQRILNYLPEEDNCIQACHNGNVGSTNIAELLAPDSYGLSTKTSKHPVEWHRLGDLTGKAHDPTEAISTLPNHVECQDCHDQHTVSSSTASAPFVNGRISGVKGRTINGTDIASSQFEYEICIKCHDGDIASVYVIRVSNEDNLRVEFNTANPSYHPVAGLGRNPDVPSLVAAYSETSRIYCTDCHDSDTSPSVDGTGAKGPHGSNYAPILREKYETSAGGESSTRYALCYRCHERTNGGNTGIMDDASFRKMGAVGGHSNHMAAGSGTPCSVCHDPHGVVDIGGSGSHTNLINFDSNVVTPKVGNTYPIFNDTGNFSGNCVLVCHSEAHESGTHKYP